MSGGGFGRRRAGRRLQRRLRRAFLVYGWRVYAVPVLLAVTVVVLVETVHGSSGSARDADVPLADTAGHAAATEHPPSRARLDTPSAALPPGGHVTQRGSGHWRIVPGTTSILGTGQQVYTYTVEVEGGIDPADYGGGKAFAQKVQRTLADPRSWIGGGKVAFRRVDSTNAHPDIRISLTSPATDHRADVCGYRIHYETSCYRSDTHRVVINLARWVRGDAVYGDDISDYRTYVVNHEVGHALGKAHQGCRTQGGPAPVMMEQTFGLSDDYIAELNRTMPGSGAVPADGKTCERNPWPHPRLTRQEHSARRPHAGPGR
jgi:hypothetical protein